MNERPQLVVTPTAPAWTVWGDRLARAYSRRPGVAVVTGLAALCLIAFTVWIWRHNAGPKSPLTDVAQQQTAPAQVSPLVSVATTPTPTPQLVRIGKPSPSQPKQNAVMASVSVNVDLADYIALRDVTEANWLDRKEITLAPVLTRLRLRMPEGSLAGNYGVSLVSEDGQLAVSNMEVRSNGKYLITRIDLRLTSKGTYRLKVEPKGGQPDFYPVKIVGR